MQLYRGDKSLLLARRWPLGRRAVVAGPHSNLAGAATLSRRPCAEAQAGRGGAGGRAGEGTHAAGAVQPYRRLAGSSRRLRRAARPALLSPAPPVPPSLPTRPLPPPPAPPRSLIDGSLKKKVRGAVLPRLASAGSPAIRRRRGTAQRPRALGFGTPGRTRTGEMGGTRTPPEGE